MDFDQLYNMCRDNFKKLKNSYSEVIKKDSNEEIRIQHPTAIIERIGNLVKDTEGALKSKEDMYLNYLYILCHLEAIDALLWVLEIES